MIVRLRQRSHTSDKLHDTEQSAVLYNGTYPVTATSTGSSSGRLTLESVAGVSAAHTSQSQEPRDTAPAEAGRQRSAGPRTHGSSSLRRISTARESQQGTQEAGTWFIVQHCSSHSNALYMYVAWSHGSLLTTEHYNMTTLHYTTLHTDYNTA